MTASRKVKVPDCTMVELMEFYEAKQPFPWHWGNSLYLEWFIVTEGRVVIEAAHYQLEIDAEPAWILTEEEEVAQQAVNAEALAKLDDDDDLPQSLEEAQADAEDARMQLLLDRVTARLERGKSTSLNLIRSMLRNGTTPQSLHQTRFKVIEIHARTATLLREAREVLNVGDDDDLGIF